MPPPVPRMSKSGWAGARAKVYVYKVRNKRRDILCRVRGEVGDFKSLISVFKMEERGERPNLFHTPTVACCIFDGPLNWIAWVCVAQRLWSTLTRWHV